MDTNNKTSSRDFSEISIIEIEDLKLHEKTEPNHLSKLKKEIEKDGILKMPIAVDKNTNVVLDGHHRLHALKQLGYKKIPVKFVDYSSPNIHVFSWRNDGKITKTMIIGAALNGKKFPPKTTRHMIQINGKLKHISAIERKVNIALYKLK